MIERIHAVVQAISDQVSKVVVGQQETLDVLLMALLARGHVLLEGVPGTGKTLLAKSLATSVQCQFRRVQMTPDLMPSDVIGTSIFDQRTGNFGILKGPVFTNILLADEVNRATPKTQSALLEAMAERAVTIDGTTHLLPRPFLVLATQNPIELAGTFPLPEAQLDRFLLKLSIGYPDLDAETEILLANGKAPAIDSLEPVTDGEEVRELIAWASDVTVSPAVYRFIIELCRATRDEPAFQLGASPRASLALLWASRVMAAASGREDVYPDDVKALLLPVMAHRLVLTAEATLRGETVENLLQRVVSRVNAPLTDRSGGKTLVGAAG